jgi:GNAT superfamily N-acetyltransferase
MSVDLRPMRAGDLDALVDLSLRAWEPVFSSFRQVMGDDIFFLQYPDWRAAQRRTVETYCRDRPNMHVWVAEVAGRVVGFIAWDLNEAEQIGEVELLAVDPDYQNAGIGTDLNTVALARMRESGMQLAAVGTGGDPGHAPARKSYEKAGYTPVPLVRYYKDLTGE